MRQEDKDRYSFPNICRRLSERKYDRGKAPEDIKLLVEVANCFFSGTAATAAATAGEPAVAGAITIGTVINAISQKGKILDAAKRVMELLKNDSASYGEKYERMMEAYTILWVAAYFDAFEKTVPKEILEKVALVAGDKENIAAKISLLARVEGEYPDTEVNLPNLVFGINAVNEQIKKVYKEMTLQLGDFITKLAFSEEADEKTQITLNAKLEELPEAALRVFMDQYLTLCSKFPEFAAYINLEKEREYKIEIDAQNKALVDLVLKSHEETAAGFQALENAICSLNEIQRKQEIKKITDRIIERYKEAVKRRIVETDEAEELNYPHITEAFVPQRYKLIIYTSNELRLELESQWNNIEPREDMLAFWGRFLLDPQSTSHLVLILGDPGGGKSLLTEMLSAKISSGAEIVVRIPLRRYSNRISDMEIEEIICQQIKDDGDAGRSIEAFKEIIGDNPERPVTLIFDGYDEVQQATGLAYPGFLRNLRKFQKHCREENRPVRIVVTSRRTLIDKAIIPIGTVVMKLLEFDPNQKAQWIETWNHSNHDLLNKANIEDFNLPKGNRDIDELASQPLLLLMLAIYDADLENKRNALRTFTEEQVGDFNRMHLYNELIRRFIRRELMKGRKGKGAIFEDAQPNKQEKMVSDEMEKLGIAALGMFVRRRLWITIPELSADFRKLEVKAIKPEDEEALEAGEVFLGSFFFIHDSRYNNKDDSVTTSRSKKREKEASFVFLHKTFYEFLVADYVLNLIFQSVIKLSKLEKSFNDIYSETLNTFGQMLPKLYISLNGTPLCVEPEITTMISEWGMQKASILLEENEDVSKEDLLAVIDDMILKHTECIRKGDMNLPKENSLLPDQLTPQRNAYYILNMVTVRTLLEGTWETEVDTWRFLAHYVKLYSYSLDEKKEVPSSNKKVGIDSFEELPLRFITIFQIERKENGIIEIKKRNRQIDLSDWSPIDARAEAFSFLQDQVSEKVYSLYSMGKPFAERKKKLFELVRYDRCFQVEFEIADLQEVFFNKDTSAMGLNKQLKRFAIMLQTKRCDAARAFSWLLYYNRLIADFNIVGTKESNGDIYHEDLITIITHDLIDRSANNTDYAWESVLNLWLQMIKNVIPLNYKRAFILNTIEVLSRIPLEKFSDDTVYAITKLFTTMWNEVWRPEKRYLLSRREFYNRGDNSVPNYALFSVRNGQRLITPKIAASILMFERCFNNNPVRLETPIMNFDIEYMINDTVMCGELPCLLWEYIMYGMINNVREILRVIKLTQTLISSPAILEYIALADTVHEENILKHVFALSMSIDRRNDNLCFALTRSANVLIHYGSISENQIEELLAVIYENDVYFRDPEGVVRLLVSLRQKGIISSDSKIMYILRETILKKYSVIINAFKKSSKIAICFLKQIVDDSISGDSFRREFVNRAILSILVQARQNGQIEEANQLEAIMKTQKY